MTTEQRNTELPHIFPGYIINLFFIIGLFSAFAFRSLIVLSYIDQALMRLVWYAGIIGYIIFFSFRYYIAYKRRKAILKFYLIEKIDTDEPLTSDEKGVIKYILSSIIRSREVFNYLAIFLLSIIAVILDLVMVHMGK